MIKLKTTKAKLTIFLFILPALFLYTVFQIIPIIGGIYFSFVEWDGLSGTKLTFVGLENYVSAFHNKQFILSLSNMARMVVFSVLLHTPIALLLAVAVNAKLKGYRIFKTIFFVPTVFPMTAVGLMWYFVFMPTGALNTLLNNIGLKHLAIPWLVNKATAMNTIVGVNVWAGIGYYMVIILAGLTIIPKDLYEAASIDGANPVQKFFNVTIPMLKPTLIMCIVMDIIGSVKVFDLVYSMTSGGPNGLTNLPTTLMISEAFKYSHYGVGSAIGIIIMLICLIGTVGSNTLLNKGRGVD